MLASHQLQGDARAQLLNSFVDTLKRAGITSLSEGGGMDEELKKLGWEPAAQGAGNSGCHPSHSEQNKPSMHNFGFVWNKRFRVRCLAMMQAALASFAPEALDGRRARGER